MSECSTDLILDSSSKIKNRFAGRVFVGFVIRHSIVHLLIYIRNPSPIANLTILSNPNTVFFIYVQEDKGIIDQDYDEYSKSDPEPNADQFLINSSATNKDSRIELTDSAGHNRTTVRRS